MKNTSSRWYASFQTTTMGRYAYTLCAWVELPLSKLALDPPDPFQMHDLLNDTSCLWHGRRNFMELDPQIVPAHIFCIRRKVRTERDFDYYL